MQCNRSQVKKCYILHNSLKKKGFEKKKRLIVLLEQGANKFTPGWSTLCYSSEREKNNEKDRKQLKPHSHTGSISTESSEQRVCGGSRQTHSNTHTHTPKPIHSKRVFFPPFFSCLLSLCRFCPDFHFLQIVSVCSSPCGEKGNFPGSGR